MKYFWAPRGFLIASGDLFAVRMPKLATLTGVIGLIALYQQMAARVGHS